MATRPITTGASKSHTRNALLISNYSWESKAQGLQKPPFSSHSLSSLVWKACSNYGGWELTNTLCASASMNVSGYWILSQCLTVTSSLIVLIAKQTGRFSNIKNVGWTTINNQRRCCIKVWTHNKLWLPVVVCSSYFNFTKWNFNWT